MCMPVITEEYHAKSIGPAQIAFDCDEKGNTVENKRLIGELIMDNNGVVYMTYDVLIPDWDLVKLGHNINVLLSSMSIFLCISSMVSISVLLKPM